MAQGSDAKKTRIKAAPVFGPLAPEEIRVIQGLGQAVLAARQGETSDPVEDDLRNEMKELGAALERSIGTATPKIQLRTGDGARQQESARDDRYAKVRSRLAAVRQRAERLRASPRSGDAVRSMRSADLLSKAAQLNDEIGAALDSPDAERAAQLARLRERLRPKTLLEVLAEQEAAAREAGEPIPEPTPTISTIVQHR
jgi:hypothetical protein